MSTSSTPTIEAARTARKELQGSIAKLVQNYMDTYGVAVTRIDLHRIEVGSMENPERWLTDLTVEIEL